jgi:hypothetical protein
MRLDVIEPFPSCPKSLAPQHWTPPPVVSAQVCRSPSVAALTFTHAPSQQKSPAAQLVAVPLHVPAPSQEPVVTAIPPEQTAHEVPAGQLSQAPALHLPSVPQLDASVTAQTPRGSLSPSITVLQVPFAAPVRAAEQAWQAPVQAESQQKPSTQYPPRHWLDEAHAEPFAYLAAQALPMQKSPLAHWLSLWQDARQVCAPQT